MSALALSLALLAATPAAPSLAELSWLVGGWADEAGEVEEHWLPVRGGAMLGLNRTVAGDKMVFFEYLRLETDEAGRVVYLASPLGRQPPVPFVLETASEGTATFGNPDHDFPQRITYTREGDVLHMRIEGIEGGEKKQSAWTLRRVDPCAAQNVTSSPTPTR